MPNFTKVLQQAQQLTTTTMQLLALAEQERWDDLIEAWPTYQRATAHLPTALWADYSGEQRETLQATLLQLQTAHDSLQAATLAWRTELQEILQNTVQSRKLNNTYR